MVLKVQRKIKSLEPIWAPPAGQMIELGNLDKIATAMSQGEPVRLPSSLVATFG